MSLPSLAHIGTTREWNGISASMISKGAREIWLTKMFDFPVDPRSKVYALYGSKHHALKEKAAADLNALLEETTDAGTSDYYDGALVDYKFVGSYALSKRTVFREIKTGGVYKSGPRKGQPRVRKVPAAFDITREDEWALQTNRYRQGLESAGFDVDSIWIEVSLRDGGTAAERYGFDRQVYMVPVPILDDQYVDDLYSALEDKVAQADSFGTAPAICSDTWDGRKCKDYCDVWMHCLEFPGWETGAAQKLREHKGG
jgi:hypothetical protein